MKQSETITERLRRELTATSVPRNQIALKTGLDPGQLSRIASGQQFGARYVDTLAEYFRLELRQRRGRRRPS